MSEENTCPLLRERECFPSLCGMGVLLKDPITGHPEWKCSFAAIAEILYRMSFKS